MKSRKLILIALASCIFPSGCDRFHRRPDNVPSSAVWIDGAFIDCTVAEHSNANRCTVFKDKTGEVLAEGLFVLGSSLGAATKADLRYAGFRDKTILLEDARTLSMSKASDRDPSNRLITERLRSISSIGPGHPVDCGKSATNQPVPEVSDCVIRAFENRRPFYVRYYLQGEV